VSDSSQSELKPEVRRVIRNTSMVGFGLGVVLSPIPLADEILLLPVYAVMAQRIARKHGLGIRQIAWRPIMSTTFAGLAARAAINVTVAYIPGVAAVANAFSALALTQIMGRYVDEVCKSPESAKAMSPAAIIEALKQSIRRTRAPAT
jgi:uncharacterized protein (DUF697 family)